MTKRSVPLRYTRFDGHAPEGPHLILQHRLGQALAIPLGAMMGVVIDPTQQSHMHRLVLKEVSYRTIVFKCQCNPTCTVIYTYRIDESGTHAK